MFKNKYFIVLKAIGDNTTCMFVTTEKASSYIEARNKAISKFPNKELFSNIEVLRSSKL